MKTRNIVFAAMIVALSVIFPYLGIPVIPIPAYSVTIGAHIAIITAMFINVPVALSAALGTTLAFFMKGTPPVVVFRALSHVIFATSGAAILRKINWDNRLKIRVLILVWIVTLVAHAGMEIVVLFIHNIFFLNLSNPTSYYFLGLGAFSLHHTADFILSCLILYGLRPILSKSQL